MYCYKIEVYYNVLYCNVSYYSIKKACLYCECLSSLVILFVIFYYLLKIFCAATEVIVLLS